ncbi:TetR/AcrR family transcriptional regulator [Curtobacterium sp. MCBD17_034]|uniref:TetR/AcrR family transcriptional regulator n=1 Tax=unclassified Curtobacterium TaxID=257496 RepID=UPI000DA8680A|nr:MULTISPECIES: TetR/AcrR family transcriptional regulator [unclassified Curtobacterium]PZF60208.1 TetR/AcrR family transcriptional regulator [Curtobacterium sp. MCBD17_034]PZM34893.1 TetR/AcrR family transcriptional regulator [Curtobacterium sp. MCBD17_031]
MSSTPPPARRPRADAARNRARIIEVARASFTDTGQDASLEGIARAAGVGIGTLYRHFPTREDLVAAVYDTELTSVLATVEPLLARHTPDVALRTFMDRYAAFVVTKRGMAETLRAGAFRDAVGSARTRERVNAAIATILAAGAALGVLRPAVPADDVTAALVGVFLATAGVEDQEQVGRLLDLLVSGLRP